jgi:hypothetical protein
MVFMLGWNQVTNFFQMRGIFGEMSIHALRAQCGAHTHTHQQMSYLPQRSHPSDSSEVPQPSKDYVKVTSKAFIPDHSLATDLYFWDHLLLLLNVVLWMIVIDPWSSGKNKTNRQISSPFSSVCSQSCPTPLDPALWEMEKIRFCSPTPLQL